MTDHAVEPALPYRRLVKTPALGPLPAIRGCFAKYATFRGRSRRSEFWWFWLLFWIINLSGFLAQSAVAVITDLVALAVVLVPYVAVGVRRLHDTGRSGWLMLLTFVPIAGLLLLVWWSEESDGDNQHGPYPMWETS